MISSHEVIPNIEVIVGGLEHTLRFLIHGRHAQGPMGPMGPWAHIGPFGPYIQARCVLCYSGFAGDTSSEMVPGFLGVYPSVLGVYPSIRGMILDPCINNPMY